MSTSRKIMVVSGIYPPDIGGPATYVPQLCAQLHRLGYEVHLISLADNPAKNEPEEPWKRTFISRGLWKPLRILKTVFVLYKYSSESTAIFSNGLFEEVGILSVFRRNKKIIAKIVGDPVWERFKNSTESNIDIESFNREKLKKEYFLQRILLTWSLNRFSEISCPSAQLKEIITGWGVKRNVTVIKNGIKCHEIERSTPIYDIVTVSRLVKWKNLDKLILAVANSDYSIAICGAGPERSNLEKLARANNVNVKFLGQLTGKALSNVINKSRVFALLSSYEGLSFSLLEAMMAGKRILVSNARGNLDVILNNESGIVVDPKSLNEISTALGVLITDDLASEKLSNQAHQIAVTYYCAEKQVDSMIKLIGA